MFSSPKPGLTQQQLRTAKLTSQLERAVMFTNREDVGVVPSSCADPSLISRTQNPLSFELSIGEHGDLAQAAEAVSSGLVNSSASSRLARCCTAKLSAGSKYLPRSLDLRSNLAERSERLRSLAVLLNELNLIDKVRTPLQSPSFAPSPADAVDIRFLS